MSRALGLDLIPRDEEGRVVNEDNTSVISLYKVHQRCAESMATAVRNASTLLPIFFLNVTKDANWNDKESADEIDGVASSLGESQRRCVHHRRRHGGLFVSLRSPSTILYQVRDQILKTI